MNKLLEETSALLKRMGLEGAVVSLEGNRTHIQWLQELCRREGFTYLDYHSAMKDEQGLMKAELADDGLHPNAAGYRVMAPLADAAIHEALPRSAGKKRGATAKAESRR